MKTIKDVREEAIKVYGNFSADKIDSRKATQLNNSLSIIIETIKTELVYRKLRKEKPEIDFLPSPQNLNQLTGVSE